MVYSGRLSLGCNICRKRRIKCDEQRPSCSYCLKKNIPCPGYPSQFDAAWRDQNNVAEQSVRRRKNANEKSIEQKRGTQTQVSRSIAPTLILGPSEDFDFYAIEFFMSTYLLIPKDVDVDRGLLDCVYPLWSTTEPGSPLQPAVIAVASCMLEAWSRLMPDSGLSHSRVRYNEAVSAMMIAMNNTRHVTDDVLMASLMLHMYEQLQSFLVAGRNRSPHVSGTSALLKSRMRQSSTAEVSQKLLLAARRHVVDRAVRDAEMVSSDMSILDDLTTAVARTPGMELDEVDIKTANVLAMASRRDEEPPTSCDAAFQAFTIATEIDRQLVEWKENLPPQWQATYVFGNECIPKSVRRAGMYNNYCTVYRSLDVANMQNQYASSRIKIQLLVLDCLAQIKQGDINDILVTASSIIQEMADSICDTIPFHLGNRTTFGRIDELSTLYPFEKADFCNRSHQSVAAPYGGFFLAGRLAHLLSPTLPLREGQQTWVLGQLLRLRKIYSITVN